MAFLSALSQVSAEKTDGGSMEIRISGNNKLNKNCTLTREKTTINDASCPIKLDSIGVGVHYNALRSGFFFYPHGDFKSSEPIVAFETVHILYDVFGNYMQTLSNTTVKDVLSKYIFNSEENWEALENEAKTYFACVSYVSRVRTKDGRVWHCKEKEIKSILDSLYTPINPPDPESEAF